MQFLLNQPPSFHLAPGALHDGDLSPLSVCGQLASPSGVSSLFSQYSPSTVGPRLSAAAEPWYCSVTPHGPSSLSYSSCTGTTLNNSTADEPEVAPLSARGGISLKPGFTAPVPLDTGCVIGDPATARGKEHVTLLTGRGGGATRSSGKRVFTFGATSSTATGTASGADGKPGSVAVAPQLDSTRAPSLQGCAGGPHASTGISTTVSTSGTLAATGSGTSVNPQAAPGTAMATGTPMITSTLTGTGTGVGASTGMGTGSSTSKSSFDLLARNAGDIAHFYNALDTRVCAQALKPLSGASAQQKPGLGRTLAARPRAQLSAAGAGAEAMVTSDSCAVTGTQPIPLALTVLLPACDSGKPQAPLAAAAATSADLLQPEPTSANPFKAQAPAAAKPKKSRAAPAPATQPSVQHPHRPAQVRADFAKASVLPQAQAGTAARLGAKSSSTTGTASGTSNGKPAGRVHPLLPQHPMQPLNKFKVLGKTELCKFHAMGKCPRSAETCAFAHGVQDLRSVSLLERERLGVVPSANAFKTSPCWSWLTSGMCKYECRCAFLHDWRISACPATLALPVDSDGSMTWNPLSSSAARPTRLGQQVPSGHLPADITHNVLVARLSSPAPARSDQYEPIEAAARDEWLSLCASVAVYQLLDHACSTDSASSSGHAGPASGKTPNPHVATSRTSNVKAAAQAGGHRDPATAHQETGLSSAVLEALPRRYRRLPVFRAICP